MRKFGLEPDPWQADVLSGRHPRLILNCWGGYLLPFIEQPALADLYRWDLSHYDPENQPVASAQLKVMQCPSAQPNRFMVHGQYSWGGKGAYTDYGPTENVDPTLADRGLVDRVGDYRGVLTLNSMTRLTEITDGTSHTILFTEDAGRPRQWQMGQAGRDNALTGCPWVGGGNAITLQGSSPDGTTRPGPCAVNCNNDHEVYSFHPSGANAAFTDGSVQFLKVAMTVRVLAALVTRPGGEAVTESDF